MAVGPPVEYPQRDRLTFPQDKMINNMVSLVNGSKVYIGYIIEGKYDEQKVSNTVKVFYTKEKAIEWVNDINDKIERYYSYCSDISTDPQLKDLYMKKSEAAERYANMGMELEEYEHFCALYEQYKKLRNEKEEAFFWSLGLPSEEATKAYWKEAEFVL